MNEQGIVDFIDSRLEACENCSKLNRSIAEKVQTFEVAMKRFTAYDNGVACDYDEAVGGVSNLVSKLMTRCTNVDERIKKLETRLNAGADSSDLPDDWTAFSKDIDWQIEMLQLAIDESNAMFYDELVCPITHLVLTNISKEQSFLQVLEGLR